MFQIKHLLFLAALALLGVGCGNSHGSPFQPQPVQPAPGMAAAQGRVVQVNPVFIVADLADAPLGANPVAGAFVRVLDLDGEEVANVQTGPGGDFVFTSLPAGYLRIEARLDPASADPDAVADFTAYPGAVARLNEIFPVTRQEATDLVLANVDPEAMVVASMQPLQPGTTVVPTGSPPNTPPEPDVSRLRDVPAAEWFFFVDEQPEADYASECRYVFVDAQTGAVTTVEGVFWPPAVNAGPIWGSGRVLFRFSGFDPDDPGPGELPEEARAIPSPEVVQLPPAPSVELQSIALLAGDIGLESHNTDPESIFAILWQASPEGYKAHDVSKMSQFLQDAGVPFENIHRLVAHTAGPGDAAREAYTEARRLVEAEIRNRFQRGEHSTLVVYITSHSGGPAFNVYKNTRGSFTNVFPEFLDLPSTQACRVRVFLQFCYARVFGDDLDAEFHTVPDAARPDHVIYCAAQTDELTYGIPYWLAAAGAGLGVRVGSRFTNKFLDFAMVANGDVTNLLNEDRTDVRSELDALFGTIDFIRGNVLFHPNAIVHEGEPEFCKEPDDGLASVTPDSLPFVHDIGVTPCPQDVGTFEIENNTNGIISFSIASDDPAIDVAPVGGTLPAGAKRTVSVSFDCTKAASFTARITVFISSAQGTEIHEIDVDATLR